MKKVVKFGGSSLASAEQFMKVGNIIHADEDRKFVVPSAPGKRFDKDTKVTDMLYACYDLAEKNHDFTSEIAKIEKRYQEIIDGLKLDLDLSQEFDKIIDNFKKKAGTNYAASRGEYLNGIIMANYLGYEFVDPAGAIRFNEAGVFDAELTNILLAKRLEGVERAVIPGFYGAMADGKVVTFSRGGSDITGSIVAKAVKADVYENWTDVSGFLVADPRIIDKPQGIEMITYAEHTWEQQFFMRTRFSRLEKQVFQSTSRIQMLHRTREHGLLEILFRNLNMSLQVLQVRKVLLQSISKKI